MEGRSADLHHHRLGLHFLPIGHQKILGVFADSAVFLALSERMAISFLAPDWSQRPWILRAATLAPLTISEAHFARSFSQHDPDLVPRPSAGQ